MYKSDYYTGEQMTKYKIQTDVNKTWLHFLQYFTNLLPSARPTERIAANSSLDSEAHIKDNPTNCSIISTSSDITTRDLYIESLKESLAAAQEYVAKKRTPTPDKPDPVALLCTELDTQCKQFDLIMKQNSALQAAMAKGNGGGDSRGGGGDGGGGGSRGGGGNRRRDCGTKAMCPNCNKMVVHAAANCFMLPANKDKIPFWYKPPKTD
jgi:uncharacterized membrane protein YgcG